MSDVCLSSLLVILQVEHSPEHGSEPRAHLVVDDDVDAAVDGLAHVADGAGDLEHVSQAAHNVVVGP